MSQLKVNSISDSAGSNGNAISLSSDGTCTAKITNNLSNRNKIINGAMQVAQRATSKTGIGGGDGYFICDRWRIFSANTAARFTVSKAADTSVTTGLPNSYKFACTTADTSLGSSDFLGFQQKIEGQNVQDFRKGTASAKQVTLSFYVKTNKSGIYTVELRDNDNSRQISKTFTVSDGNWNRYTLTYPADTTGVIDNNNEDSFQVNFWLIAGSNYTSGTLNSSAWAAQSNTNRVSSSNVNIGDSTSNTWEITGVQLEVGDVATDFEHRSYGDELLRCQRYFNLIADGSLGTAKAVSDGFWWSGNEFDFIYTFPVEMRGTPEIYQTTGTDYYLVQGAGLAKYIDSWTLQYTSKRGSSQHGGEADLGGTAGAGGHITINNSAARLGYQAEL